MALEAQKFPISVAEAGKHSTSVLIFGHSVPFAITEKVREIGRRQVKEYSWTKTIVDYEGSAIHAGNNPNANSFLGWVSDQGEECGDYPVSEAGGHLTEVFQEVELTDNSGTVPVQFMYSDAAHGPEGPIAQANPPVNSLQRSVESS